jgi:predicted glycoside hydrolase/deacetylase ChbG (UPF0249 family)
MIMKKLILCADDFGLSAGISRGIIDLAQSGRLSAVGCIVNQPEFVVQAPTLLALKNQVQIGLHFNLTEGAFLSRPEQNGIGLNKLLLQSHLHLLNKQLIANEFKAQLDKFIQVMDRLPDFIDGHQHVHQFPVIRKIILNAYDKRLRLNKTYIRSTYPAISLLPYLFKAKILAMTGGRALLRALKQRNIPHNMYFSGIYDFKPGSNYRQIFQKWLQAMPSDTLIMCHPGQGFDAQDPIAAARIIEYDYFRCAFFLEDLQKYKVEMS